MVNLALLDTFTNKVEVSQKVYRRLLKAMSEPGKIVDVSFVTKKYLSQSDDVDLLVYPSVWAIAQSLLDSDCKVYVSPRLSQQTFTQSLSFYTDVAMTNNKKDASFAFITIDELDDSLHEFHVGGLETPHESCTFIVQTPEITKNPQLTLTGPGIERVKRVGIDGLTEAHIQLLQSNHRLYPCGVDFIFCAPEKVLGLPRSTSLLFNPEISETANSSESSTSVEL